MSGNVKHKGSRTGTMKALFIKTTGARWPFQKEARWHRAKASESLDPNASDNWIKRWGKSGVVAEFGKIQLNRIRGTDMPRMAKYWDNYLPWE